MADGKTTWDSFWRLVAAEMNHHGAVEFWGIGPEGHVKLQPDHVHVSEIRVERCASLDCGGAVDRSTTLVLQCWHSDDYEHRLSAGKLLKIFDGLAAEAVDSESTSVVVELQGKQSLERWEADAVVGNRIYLKPMVTECKAEDQCKPKGCGPQCC